MAKRTPEQKLYDYLVAQGVPTEYLNALGDEALEAALYVETEFASGETMTIFHDNAKRNPNAADIIEDSKSFSPLLATMQGLNVGKPANIFEALSRGS